MECICGTLTVDKKILINYSDKVCDFLDYYSAKLRHDAEAKTYPDVISFAFWARKGNIQKKRKEFLAKHGDECRIGKGLVFHIAPSNVPVNCMFTYAFGLLAGNANIVRIPSKDFPQIKCMIRVLDEVLKEEAFSEIREMTSFVRYDRTEQEYTRKYSSICDMRVIWGGDDTIHEIRRIELPARSTEITFADRYSFGIVDVDTILDMTDDELKTLAEGFYNDTYLMDQNACSTPHLICFRRSRKQSENIDMENNLDKAKKRFWNSIAEVSSKYELVNIKVSDKYTDLCEKIMSSETNRVDDKCVFDGKIIKSVKRYDNLLYVCTLTELPTDTIVKCRGRYGMFFEYCFESLDELYALSDTKVQTCALCGIDKDEVRKYIVENGFRGIDRIVPFGKTLDIDTIWDGYDLISCMSRVID